MILMIPGTAGLTGVPYFSAWAGERKETTGAYRIGRNNTELQITIDGVWQDSVDTKCLLDFLGERKVISNPEEWRVESVRDTDGLTYTDESFTTVVFVRTPSL